ncbi:MULTISPECIES: spore maturation protein [Sedimentibacter]|uniref:Spore maturation protein n=1 Tax=Sedimentibacter hydroxybenzoicus DSM 7310 TaxID=1123245 RepID=A0A974BHG6_SEDHY|nr:MULTISPECIES: nucleoside recognition domain-containing protein [Sedimentibacter]NYB73245.1 spore maturation protein [Sedimentibacter hydroxybenzoicus DSM 7310]
MTEVLNIISKYAIPLILLVIPVYALAKGVKVYSVFTEGAKEGLKVSAMIVPYLVCMLCAIGMFRASGAMDWLTNIINPITSLIGLPGEILPMGIMRSFSGGGAEGMMSDLLTMYGTQSQIGRIASVALGSTETTFYVIAVYFGAVGITNVRHSVIAGLLGDLASLIASAVIVNAMWF